MEHGRMSRTLRTEDVELELGSGEWTARWRSCDVVLGPCHASVDGAGIATTEAGAWRVETTRTGARARWTSGNGVWIELRLPATGDVVEVRAGYRPPADEEVRAVVALTGPVAPAVERTLVNGYDSWSYAGVRGGAGPVDSYWSGTLATAAGALALQALTSDQLVTRIVGTDTGVEVRAEPAPTHHLVDGTWGHENAAGTRPQLVADGEEITSEVLAITADPDPLVATERVAQLVPRRAWDGPPALGWESWYHYATRISTRRLLENGELLRERFGDRPGFDLLQIDDGWQVAHGAWWPRERFPDDFGEVIDVIHRLDLRAGLWLAPFMVEPGAPGLGTEHEDWCVVDEETGETLKDRHGRWALDASNPAALDFLRELGRTVRSWGVDMVKLDFLYLGAQEGRRHDPGVTGTAALRRGLGAFVDQLGEQVYVLGCGAPMLPMVGICHANRIGHDLAVPVLAREWFDQPRSEGWTGWQGIKAQARQAAARWFTHGRWFHNDPEIVMAWGSDGRGGPDGYSLEEAHTQAVVAALAGGPFLLADELATLLPEERAVLVDPGVLDLAWDEHGFRPLDLFDHVDDGPRHAYAQPDDLPSVWVATRAVGSVVALFNWTDRDGDRRAPDGTTVEVPAHGVRIIRQAR
jgi:alpha-galactosidase